MLVDFHFWELGVLDNLESPHCQQIQKLIIRQNSVLKVNWENVLRNSLRINNNDAAFIRQIGNVLGILRSAHDAHENSREGGLTVTIVVVRLGRIPGLLVAPRMTMIIVVVVGRVEMIRMGGGALVRALDLCRFTPWRCG